MLVALVGAMATGTKAVAAGKRAGVPKFEGAQEAVVRKQVMAVLKAHGFELVKSRRWRGIQSAARAGIGRRVSEGGQGARPDGHRHGRGRQEEGEAQAFTTGAKARCWARRRSRVATLASSRRRPPDLLGQARERHRQRSRPSGFEGAARVAEAPDEAESAPEPAEEGKSRRRASRAKRAPATTRVRGDDEGSSRSSRKQARPRRRAGTRTPSSPRRARNRARPARSPSSS